MRKTSKKIMTVLIIINIIVSAVGGNWASTFNAITALIILRGFVETYEFNSLIKKDKMNNMKFYAAISDIFHLLPNILFYKVKGEKVFVIAACWLCLQCGVAFILKSKKI